MSLECKFHVSLHFVVFSVFARCDMSASEQRFCSREVQLNAAGSTGKSEETPVGKTQCSSKDGDEVWSSFIVSNVVM